MNRLDAIGKIDRFVHEPARLTILTVLDLPDPPTNFMGLREATRLSKGNLSVQLGKLEERRLVEIERGYNGKKPCTTVRLTKAGRAALRTYWRALGTVLAAPNAV